MTGRNIAPTTICLSVILPNKNTNGSKTINTYGGIPNIREPIKRVDSPASPLNSKKGKGTIKGINRHILKYVL